jgi:hypothetical protein
MTKKLIAEYTREIPVNRPTSTYHLLSNIRNIKVYKIIDLPALLYECETLSLTLRE